MNKKPSWQKPSVTDDKLNYTLKKPQPTKTKLDILKASFLRGFLFFFYSNPLTSSVLSLVFAWLLQNDLSLYYSPLQTIILPQRMLRISRFWQEFLRAANPCLACIKHCSLAVSYLSDPGKGVRVSQGAINQCPAPTPPPQHLLRSSLWTWSAFGGLEQIVQEAFTTNIFHRPSNLIDWW